MLVRTVTTYYGSISVPSQDKQRCYYILGPQPHENTPVDRIIASFIELAVAVSIDLKVIFTVR